MAKFILTKKRSSAWNTLKEGESIIVEIKSEQLHYSDVYKYLEKIGKKPTSSECSLNSFDVKKL